MTTTSSFDPSCSGISSLQFSGEAVKVISSVSLEISSCPLIETALSFDVLPAHAEIINIIMIVQITLFDLFIHPPLFKMLTHKILYLIERDIILVTAVIQICVYSIRNDH